MHTKGTDFGAALAEAQRLGFAEADPTADVEGFDAASKAAILASFGLMSIALKSLPFGTAYAVWTGIGAAGSIVIGMTLYGEPASGVRVLCLSMIVAGMIGLKLSTPA